MSEFYAKISYTYRIYTRTRFTALISDLRTKQSTIRQAANGIRGFKGAGIEEQYNNLIKCVSALRELEKAVTLERNTLDNIVDSINSSEQKAMQILGKGKKVNFKDMNFAKTGNLTKSLSNSDLGKLVNQLKYYTQSHKDAKALYNKLMEMYNSNKTYKMTDSEYEKYKNTLTEIFARDYVYSTVEYFKPAVKNETSGLLKSSSAGNSIKLSGTDKLTSKNKFDLTFLNEENSFDLSSMKITCMSKSGNDYLTDVLTLSNIKISEDTNFLNFDIKKLYDKIKNKKVSIDEISDFYHPFGIEISGSTSAIKGTETYTYRINDDISYYNKNVYTLGELTAELDLNESELKAKAGYTIASVKSSHGIKTNNGAYSISGKMTAGQEYGVEVGIKKGEVSAGLFGIGIEADDGFDFYVWQ